FHSITFERPGEGRWRSPIQILFPYDHAEGEEQPSWREAHIGIHFIDKFSIGSNGWTAYGGGGKTIDPIPGTQEEVLDEIATSLREYELFPFDQDVPNVINDMSLIDAWDKLSASFEEYGIDDVVISRSELGEFVSFEFAGSSFRLCFPVENSRVLLEMDGEVVKQASSQRARDVGLMVGEHLAIKDLALMP
ncbi:hypothetical protein ACCT09_07500, partial [Rhizobium ruizarguesonis]